MSHDALPWTPQGLDLSRIQIARIRHDEDLFFLLCSSSFVESASDLCTQNLVDHFAGDEALQTWLRQHGEHEELEHGRALTAYVRTVWPEFDWNSGFDAFWNDYSKASTADHLEPDRMLELAARCVMKTGSASRYRALHDMTDEPVLKQLTGHIKSDKIRHYKHFYRRYCVYRERNDVGRYQVFRAIRRRANDIGGEQKDIALRHVFNQCYPQQRGDEKAFRHISDRTRALLRRHLSTEMTMKMLLKPLDLPARLLTVLEKPLARITGKLFRH